MYLRREDRGYRRNIERLTNNLFRPDYAVSGAQGRNRDNAVWARWVHADATSNGNVEHRHRYRRHLTALCPEFAKASYSLSCPVAVRYAHSLITDRKSTRLNSSH